VNSKSTGSPGDGLLEPELQCVEIMGFRLGIKCEDTGDRRVCRDRGSRLSAMRKTLPRQILGLNFLNRVEGKTFLEPLTAWEGLSHGAKVRD